MVTTTDSMDDGDEQQIPAGSYLGRVSGIGETANITQHFFTDVILSSASRLFKR